MRVAVSIPDGLVEEADSAAEQVNVSRRHLYTIMIAAYLKEREEDAITEKLNEVYSRVDSRLDEAFARALWQVLARDPW